MITHPQVHIYNNTTHQSRSTRKRMIDIFRANDMKNASQFVNAFIRCAEDAIIDFNIDIFICKSTVEIKFYHTPRSRYIDRQRISGFLEGLSVGYKVERIELLKYPPRFTP